MTRLRVFARTHTLYIARSGPFSQIRIHITLATPLHIPTTFCDVPFKIEGVIPEHQNVHYVYFIKIAGCPYCQLHKSSKLLFSFLTFFASHCTAMILVFCNGKGFCHLTHLHSIILATGLTVYAC